MEKNNCKYYTCGYCGAITHSLTYNSWLDEEVCKNCDNDVNWENDAND